MSTIIHATETAELLGLVPALAGFTPRQSVVMLPFRDSRAHGAMRVDLPDPDVDPDAFAETALHALLQVDGIDATAIIVYTDDSPHSVPDGILLPHLPLVETLVGMADETGLRVIDVLCVTPDGWADYLDPEPDIRPLDDIPSAPDIPGIGDLRSDQSAGADLPVSDLAERERVGRALAEVELALARRRRGGWRRTDAENPILLAVGDTVLDDLPAFAESLIERPGLHDDYRCATLLWCLSRPALRDAILVQWATDQEFGARALDVQREYSTSRAPIPDEIGRVFLGRGARPDPDRLGCALQTVRLAAARAPRHAKASALVAAAWLSWAMGRSSHAARYVDEALHLEPEHSMASLISSMLASAVLPEWALRRP